MSRSSRRDVPRPFACERCFADKVLIAWIRNQNQIGNCSWCRAKKVHVAPIVELAPLLRDVADMYQESEDGGEPLAWLLQEDWEIFSERIVGKDQVVIGNELLDDLVTAILHADLHPKEIYEGMDYTGRFRRSGLYHSSLEEDWEERVARLFGESPPEQAIVLDPDFPVDPLEFAIEDRGRSFAPKEPLYRARIHSDRARHDRFTLAEMGAPPPEKAKAQRANRVGEPVLYMATDEATALAEVRAWKRAVVAVARMKIQADVRVLDLSDLGGFDSPFFVENLGWHVEAHELLWRFAEELSCPIMPNEPESHYKPSQHICDLVRKIPFDGITYPSAMGPGHNVVLFDPGAAVPIDLVYKQIVEVRLGVEVVKAEGIYLDEWPWD